MLAILVSPAKTIDTSLGWKSFDVEVPSSLKKTQVLVDHLNKLKIEELKDVLRVSVALTQVNFDRYKNWSYQHTSLNSKPAILSYSGDLYRQLNTDGYTIAHQEYAQEHVRILSGLYGLLKPYDLIQPYRLEMGARIPSMGQSLREYWTEEVTNRLNEEFDEDTPLLNLASKQYIEPILMGHLRTRVTDVIFKQQRKDTSRVITFLAKRARGQLLEFAIRNKVNDIEGIKSFNIDGYRLVQEWPDRLVFETSAV